MPLSAAQSTYDRLKKAAETPGAISGNELVQAQEQVTAGEALLQSKVQAKAATEETVKAQSDLQSYLRITSSGSWRGSGAAGRPTDIPSKTGSADSRTECPRLCAAYLYGKSGTDLARAGSKNTQHGGGTGCDQ